MEGFSLNVGAKVNVKDVQKQLDMTTAKITVTPVMNTKGLQTGVKTVTELKDSMGGFATVTEKANTEGKVLDSTVTKMGKSFSTSSKNIDSASKSATTFSQKIVDSTKKVAQFAISTTLIGLVTGAFYKAVSAVKDYDDALTNASKVSDLSGSQLEKYAEQLGKLGSTVARTRTEMVENAATFMQAGYSADDAKTLSSLAAEYQNVADKEISASEASSFLVSQMKAYNLSANDATTILDQLNEVSNKYAVSSSDIATGLTKSASALANLGNSSDQTIGLITAG